MGDTNFDMTDEELAAMADDTVADDDEQDVDAEIDEHEQEPATDEPVVPEPEAVVETEPEPVAAEPESPTTQAPTQQPTQQPQVQDKFGVELDKLNADMADLKQKFDDGDISIDEYMDSRFAIERKVVKIEAHQERMQQDAQMSWDRANQEFLANEDNKALRENDVLYGAFAMQVNKLIGDPASEAMSDADLLRAARDKVFAAFRIPQGSQPSKDESAIRAAKKEAADRGKAPTTLQGVPAAAQADDVDQSPFAYLDRLSGEQLEAAVAKLSEADQLRWLHSR